MTFHVRTNFTETKVSKRVPIRNIKTNFCYGFTHSGMTEKDIQAAIGICKKRISKAIRAELIEKGVQPPSKSNGHK